MTTPVPDYPVHPLGSEARVLLLSVFGPYAQDDQYGSRLINPMELFHNQVTRVQHAFSVRSFHRSWGLMLIQVNLKAPCTLLDFPSEERFLEEIKTRKYDVIGISSIIPNLLKVHRMCRLIRKHQPGDHRRRRAYRQPARSKAMGRCGPHRQRGRCAMDAQISRRGRESANPASSGSGKYSPPHHGHLTGQPPWA